MPSLVLLLLSILPHAEIPRDRVDLAEVNHFYSETGEHVFDQIIFWEWSDDDAAFRVRDWRMLGGRATPRNYQNLPGLLMSRRPVIWADGAIVRQTEAGSFRETWTQFDPELMDREFLPKEKRRGLTESRPRTLPTATGKPSPRSPEE